MCLELYWQAVMKSIAFTADIFTADNTWSKDKGQVLDITSHQPIVTADIQQPLVSQLACQVKGHCITETQNTVAVHMDKSSM
jgi:hypothetical protein